MSPNPRDGEKILDHARLCEEEQASEAAWNSSVHDRVFCLALWEEFRTKARYAYRTFWLC
jgi:hypothetical protein